MIFWQHGDPVAKHQDKIVVRPGNFVYFINIEAAYDLCVDIAVAYIIGTGKFLDNAAWRE